MAEWLRPPRRRCFCRLPPPPPAAAAVAQAQPLLQPPQQLQPPSPRCPTSRRPRSPAPAAASRCHRRSPAREESARRSRLPLRLAARAASVWARPPRPSCRAAASSTCTRACTRSARSSSRAAGTSTPPHPRYDGPSARRPRPLRGSATDRAWALAPCRRRQGSRRHPRPRRLPCHRPQPPPLPQRPSPSLLPPPPPLQPPPLPAVSSRRRPPWPRRWPHARRRARRRVARAATLPWASGWTCLTPSTSGSRPPSCASPATA